MIIIEFTLYSYLIITYLFDIKYKLIQILLILNYKTSICLIRYHKSKLKLHQYGNIMTLKTCFSTWGSTCFLKSSKVSILKKGEKQQQNWYFLTFQKRREQFVPFFESSPRGTLTFSLGRRRLELWHGLSSGCRSRRIVRWPQNLTFF